MAAWCDKWRAFHPLIDEHPASPPAKGPAPLSTEPPKIPHPLPKVHHEKIIEDDSVVRVDESDESVEQIDNPNSVLDSQEERGLVHFLSLDLATMSCKSSK